MFSRMSKVNLRDYQVDNYHKLLNVLDKNYFYIDNSMMGRGKTHVTSKIAEDLGLPVVVVCFDEISSNMVWKKALDNYDIEYYYGMNNKPLIIPYSQLISTGSCQPKHGMLQKIINIFHTRDKKEAK